MESATKGRFRAEHLDRKLEVGPGNAYEGMGSLWGTSGKFLGGVNDEISGSGPW
jgi:hypothetical protein